MVHVVILYGDWLEGDNENRGSVCARDLFLWIGTLLVRCNVWAVGNNGHRSIWAAFVKFMSDYFY